MWCVSLVNVVVWVGVVVDAVPALGFMLLLLLCFPLLGLMVLLLLLRLLSLFLSLFDLLGLVLLFLLVLLIALVLLVLFLFGVRVGLTSFFSGALVVVVVVGAILDRSSGTGMRLDILYVGVVGGDADTGRCDTEDAPHLTAAAGVGSAGGGEREASGVAVADAGAGGDLLLLLPPAAPPEDNTAAGPLVMMGLLGAGDGGGEGDRAADSRLCGSWARLPPPLSCALEDMEEEEEEEAKLRDRSILGGSFRGGTV